MTKTFLASTLAMVLLGGCLTEEEPDLGTNQGASFEEWRAQLGREPGTGKYVVDWDIVLDESELFEHWSQYQQGALAIYRINGVDIKWSDAQKINLTYCIGSTFGGNTAAVLQAMQGATEGGWELFGNVNFVHVASQDGAGCTASNPNVLFDVNQVNSGGQYLARAFFPNDARANRNVLVDITAFNPQNTGGIPLTNIMIHELGHTLGFRHEHIRTDQGRTVACPEGTEYRGITPYDVVSTMHYPQCGSPNNTLALSQRDKEGVALIYGAPIVNMPPVASVQSPQNNSTVGPSFMVDAMVTDGNNNLTKVELFIDGQIYGAPMTTAPFVFQVTNLALGPHQLKITATDGSGAKVDQIVNVTVQANGGDGSGSGSGTGNGNGTGTGGGDGSQDVTGGCNTGGGSAGILFGLGLLGLAIRRRR
jgi:uncharacterized protein (TIGR03382 family)